MQTDVFNEIFNGKTNWIAGFFFTLINATVFSPIRLLFSLKMCLITFGSFALKVFVIATTKWLVKF